MTDSDKKRALEMRASMARVVTDILAQVLETTAPRVDMAETDTAQATTVVVLRVHTGQWATAALASSQQHPRIDTELQQTHQEMLLHLLPAGMVQPNPRDTIPGRQT